MIWGYARVSTVDKQDVTRQVTELKKMGADKVIVEMESGMKEDRKKLLLLLQETNSRDTIMALEVSRITRSTKQLCEILDIAKQKKLKLIFGTFILDCSNTYLDPMSLGMLKMMSVFAELEAQLIRARVKSGLEHAKAKGSVLGRPSTTYEDIPEIFFRYLPKYQNNNINKSEFARLTGLSYPSIYKYLDIVKK